jgi:hypothetical protein
MSEGVISAKDKFAKFIVAGADVSTVVSFVCTVIDVISDATVILEISEVIESEVISPLLT